MVGVLGIHKGMIPLPFALLTLVVKGPFPYLTRAGTSPDKVSMELASAPGQILWSAHQTLLLGQARRLSGPGIRARGPFLGLRQLAPRETKVGGQREN